MGALNRQGPDEPDLSAPAPVDPAELAERIGAGEWVVDLRDRTAYAADHLEGTDRIALGGQFSTYVGWLAPWGAPLTLIAEQPRQLAEAQLQLARIGIDELAGAAAGTLDELACGHRPAALRARRLRRVQGPARRRRRRAGRAPRRRVRRRHRRRRARPARRAGDAPGRAAGGPAVGALRQRVPRLIAASLLDRAGRDVVLIDDDYDNAGRAGFALAA